MDLGTIENNTVSINEGRQIVEMQTSHSLQKQELSIQTRTILLNVSALKQQTQDPFRLNMIVTESKVKL